MEDELNFKDAVLQMRETLTARMNLKFDEISSRLEDFEDTLNDALEQLSERQYSREANDLFERE